MENNLRFRSEDTLEEILNSPLELFKDLIRQQNNGKVTGIGRMDVTGKFEPFIKKTMLGFKTALNSSLSSLTGKELDKLLSLSESNRDQTVTILITDFSECDFNAVDGKSIITGKEALFSIGYSVKHFYRELIDFISEKIVEFAQLSNKTDVRKIRAGFSSAVTIEVFQKMSDKGYIVIPNGQVSNWVYNAFAFPGEPIRGSGQFTMAEGCKGASVLSEFFGKLWECGFFKVADADNKGELYDWIKAHIKLPYKFDSLKTNLHREKFGNKGKKKFNVSKAESNKLLFEIQN